MEVLYLEVLYLLIREYHLTMGMYLPLFSIRTQRFIAKSATATGRPDVSVSVCVSMIPIITGKIIMAPSARYFGRIKSNPAKISTQPSKGMTHPIFFNEEIR